ncbi:MAG: hypothetical protein LUF85_00010 [Bacteroides sp.]|nr:hypothetical protein [Bacteroides sp.]
MLTNKERENVDSLIEKIDVLTTRERDYLFQNILKKPPLEPYRMPPGQEIVEALDTIASHCGTVSAAANLLGMTASTFYGYRNGRVPIGPRVSSRIKNVYAMITLIGKDK